MYTPGVRLMRLAKSYIANRMTVEYTHVEHGDMRGHSRAAADTRTLATHYPDADVFRRCDQHPRETARVPAKVTVKAGRPNILPTPKHEDVTIAYVEQAVENLTRFSA